LAETQAWRRDRSHVHRAAEAAGAWSPEFSAMFAEASTAFQEALEARGALWEYAVKDAMIAATYLMLAAESLGLASSPMNGWDEAQVKEVVGIADRDDLAIALLVSLGYPAEARPHPGRQPRRLNVFRGPVRPPRGLTAPMPVRSGYRISHRGRYTSARWSTRSTTTSGTAWSIS
jgi:nitroreductase